MTNRRPVNKRARQRQDYKLELDYDKLADSIVKAQQKVDNEKERHSKVRKSIMSFLNGTIYISISILCFYGICYLWRYPSSVIGNSLILKIIFSILLGVVGIILFLAQQESLGETEEESNQHFNTNLSLVALIIALIALFK